MVLHDKIRSLSTIRHSIHVPLPFARHWDFSTNRGKSWVSQSRALVMMLDGSWISGVIGHQLCRKELWELLGRAVCDIR